MPRSGNRGLAGETGSGIAAGEVLPPRVHPTGRIAGSGAQEPENHVRHPDAECRGDSRADRTRREVRRWKARDAGGVAHLDARAGAPPARAHAGTRRRARQGRRLAAVPQEVPRAGQGPVPVVSGEVHEVGEEVAAERSVSAGGLAEGMGGLLPADLQPGEKGAPLPRSLRAPDRHHQQPHPLPEKRQCHLPLPA